MAKRANNAGVLSNEVHQLENALVACLQLDRVGFRKKESRK